MAVAGSLQLSYDLGLYRNQGCNNQFKDVLGRTKLPLLSTRLSLCSSFSFRQHDLQSIRLSRNLYRPIHSIPYRSNGFRCTSFLGPNQALQLPCKQALSVALTRSYNVIQSSPIVLKLVSAIGVIMFSIWGIEPLLRQSRNLLLHKNDSSWKKSGTYFVLTSYIQPLLLWAGAILICRTLDPVVLPTEASQVVKMRLLNFLRSLSTVLAFAYCLSSVIQQAQKFFMESVDTSDTRNMGFQFAGKAVYSAVWVAAGSLFMELLGFSTQKWLTAGGLGTVLLTLAGREIFTNFLSSAMIHATRPFVVNEWIQTKIEGYEVSGTVEHVGWWSPTIVRGEDREAVHIPNHKFTVNVVRNLTQKSHWRIKTHLAISHLDAHKIHNIVADMRKVLAKNPQVEQQRLHRRVFLDNVHTENQALLILISCFVKTSHHEEYLCVKEIILLDLLRVISHHRARLATPIRTVQKIYSDADMENVPFADAIFNRGGVANRPLLLIEPSYKINGEDKAKPQTRSGQDKAPSASPVTKSGAGTKSDAKSKETPKSDPKVDPKTIQTPISDPKENRKATTVAVSDPKTPDMMTAKPSPKSAQKNADTSYSSIKAATSVPDDQAQNKMVSDIKQTNRSAAGNLRQNNIVDGVSSSESGGLQEADRKSVPQLSKSRSSLEENLVLGVALEGSKRTLPIEEDMVSHPSLADAKETATSRRNGTGSSPAEKERKDGQTPNSPTATSEH